jgi:glutaredoxin
MSKPLENHTVDELKKLAKTKGLRGYSKLPKAKLIAFIRKSGGGGGGGGGGGVIDKCKIKKCTPDAICNPLSGRCVKKTGSIGKKLLSVPIVRTPTTPPIKPLVYIPPPVKPPIKPLVYIPPPVKPPIKPLVYTPPQPVKPPIPPPPVKPPIPAPSEWIIYSIKGCNLCKKAKDLLDLHNIRYFTKEINDIHSFQYSMKHIIGEYKYFPVILKDNHFIGGYQELVSIISPASPLHMMIPPPVVKTTYKGIPWQELVGMIYLLHKYPKDCVAIPVGIMSSSGKKITEYGINVNNFNQTALDWNERIQNFVIPPGLWTSVKKCLEKGSNFIIIPLGFTCKDGLGHANFLIYDSKTKELERFEPNGYISGDCFNEVNLDEKLKDLFNSNVKKDMVKKVYSPLEFCPRQSFQYIQHIKEIFEKQEGDPAGFCAVWTAWYADTRMANPNKSRKQVVDMALWKLRNNSESMTKFIRSYSAFLVKAGELLKKSKDPSAVFASLVQKYT